MSKTSSTTLKTYFETGDIPTQTQFADFIDSYDNLLDSNLTSGFATGIDAIYPASQATGYPITKSYTMFWANINNIGGATMPVMLFNARYVIANWSQFIILVYPASGEHWENLGTNVPFILQPKTTIFVSGSYYNAWQVLSTFAHNKPLLPPAKSMLTVICGNSIAVLDQYSSGLAYNGSTVVSNFFAGSPMRFRQITAATRVDRYGNYGYSGATLTTILPDLDTNWFPALATANLVPELVIGKALLENDIHNDVDVTTCINSLNRWIYTIKAKWKNVKIILYTPHPAFFYDTTGRKDCYTSVRNLMLNMDNGTDIFVTDMDFAASQADKSIPQYIDITASQTGTTLTVSAISSGVIRNGSTLFDPANVNTVFGIIRCQLTGTAGSTGTYLMSTTATVSSSSMRMSLYTDSLVHPNARGGIYYGREVAKTFARMASSWVQPFYTQAANIIFDGTTAASGTGTSGTFPTGLAQSNANGTFVCTANQPFFTEVITASAVAPPSYTATSCGAYNTTSQTLSPSANTVSAYVKFIIVSGAINLRDIQMRGYLTDGSGSAFKTMFFMSTNDSDVDWQDGDVITLITPPEIAVTSNFTAMRIYLNRYMKILGGTTTIQYLEQGVLINT